MSELVILYVRGGFMGFMDLRDLLIMEVPSGALKKVIRKNKIEAKLNSIEEMASAIAEKDVENGDLLVNEFRFAGSTSVNLNIIMKGISPVWHNKEYFKNYLENKFSKDIFNQGIRPMLDTTPKLIRAYELGEKLVLAFSFLGPARRFLDDFQIVSRRPQIVEYVIIHLSPFAIEVRASHDQNKLFRDAILKIMSVETDVVWDKATKLNDQQALDLAKKLNAKLRSAKHKMTEGVYATKEVTANTQVEDLEITEQYQKEFSNQPMKKKTFIFNYTYSFGYEDKISYVITDEGLWLRSKVGEEVISHILDKIIEIRYSSETESEDMFDEELEEGILIKEDEHIVDGILIK